jgi:5-methylcytosine-specific restriction endonuclease McrA
MSQVAYTPPEEVVGREPEEWIGATPDTPVPDRVKLRVFRRWNGRCYLSGRKIAGGDPWDVEHVKALGLGGENRESNLRPALKEPHKDKTAADRDLMAKADRIARKHHGLDKPKRPFPKRKDPWGWRP